MSVLDKIQLYGKTYDLPSGASAIVEDDNLIINNGNVNNLKSSQLVTETMTVTTNAYGWVYFPENLLVVTASVTDIYKHLVLDRYERPNGYQYIASTYLETNSAASYIKLLSNRTYDVTYTYLKDVPINAGHIYSQDEKIVGTWIDGRTIYEKVIDVSFPISGNTWTNTNVSTDATMFLDCYLVDDSDCPITYNILASNESSAVYVMILRNATITAKKLILKYTKD